MRSPVAIVLMLSIAAAEALYFTATSLRVPGIEGPIAAMLGLLGVAAVAASRFVVVPLERRLARGREFVRSLFEDNAEAVVAYKLDGTVASANAAAGTLFGCDPHNLRGRSFSAIVAEECRDEAFRAFAGAAAGDASKLEATAQLLDGRRIDISASLMPSVIDGRIDGVYAILRDVTGERRRAKELAEQATRIRELYLVAASGGDSAGDQIRRALELGCSRTGLDWGFVSRVENRIATIVASVGNNTVPTGSPMRVEKKIVKAVLTTRDVVVVDDAASEPLLCDEASRSGKLSTFVACPVIVDGEIYGACCFTTSKRREETISESDRDFIRLIGALIGAAIERENVKRRLDAMALSDRLTGLPNRASLEARVAAMLADAEATGERFAVHFIDLDGFKAVNDEYGHAVGDTVLVGVAERLRRTIGARDIAARLGGDEFVVVSPEAGPFEAANLAARLIEGIDAPIDVDGETIRVGASIGIAHYPADGNDVAMLLRNADRALYAAKTSGRGRFVHSAATIGMAGAARARRMRSATSAPVAAIGTST